MDGFSEPVCNIFRKKIVDGQVCYEADVNQFKSNITHWEDALQKGFGLIVDTNDEYDVKNLVRRIKPETTSRTYSIYKQNKKGNSLRILLKSISNFDIINIETSLSFLLIKIL